MKKIPKDLEATLEYLEATGVAFMLPRYTQYGVIGPLQLDRGQLLSYLQDPLGFAARYHGVTPVQLQAWYEAGSNREVYCSSSTLKGLPCKNPVMGSHPDNEPLQWVNLQGGYCKVHGG